MRGTHCLVVEVVQHGLMMLLPRHAEHQRRVSRELVMDQAVLLGVQALLSMEGW